MRERVPTLDGWRAVAVLIVIWGHLMPGFYGSESAYYADSLSRYGGFGVDIFFGISGLIITKLLLDEQRRFGNLSFAGFYVRRGFRILPPCFAYLAAVLIVLGMRSKLELFSSIFFFRNYIPDSMGSIATKHLWSLAVEEHFYLFWPLLLAFVLSASSNTQRRATIVAWISISCGLWRVADAQNHITEKWLPLVPVHFRTDLRLDALLWGCTAAFFLSDEQSREKLRAVFRPWKFYATIFIALACIAIYSQLTSLWLAILIPMALMGTVLHPEWMVSRALDHRAMRFIGRISYSLYLWQQMFLVSGWEDPRKFQKFPWNIGLALVCALSSYFLLEKPCMKLGRKLSARIRDRRPVESPALAEV